MAMKVLRAIPIFLCAPALVASAHAQSTFPAKPVKIVVGFPAGSSADIPARILGKGLADSLGQAFVVENRPGAGSNIAAELVARAPADGYTLLMGTVANTISAALNSKLSFNFAEDFAAVGMVGTVSPILVTHPSLGVSSVRELIAAAKAKPGQITYGSAGNGTQSHLSGELFGLLSGVTLLHVPYKGGTQAVTDLVAGRIMLMFSSASTVLPYVKTEKIKALASSGAQRASVAPDLPTIAEAGVPGFETTLWIGLFAPAATPRDMVERISEAVGAVLATADVSMQITSQSIDPQFRGSKEFAAYVRREIDTWRRVVKQSGVKSG